MKLLLLLSLLPLVQVAPPPHEFHLSRTRVEYLPQNQEWQISIHIFIDYLALAMSQKGTPNLFLGTKKESPQADGYIQAYLQRFLKLTEGEQALSWEWVGKETSEDLAAFYLYLTVPQVVSPKRLRVSNQLLFDTFADQQNMIQIIGPGQQRQSFLFHQDYWQDAVTF